MENNRIVKSELKFIALKIKQVPLNAVKFAFIFMVMKQKKAVNDFVILVNNAGKKTGIAGKMEAHEKGLLHRAFSIFIFNDQGEMLLQQRAANKYHFGGLWTNACCSHPRPGEKVLQAAKRRLKEELGVVTKLVLYDAVTYSFYDKENGLTEHEFDYVITGNYTGTFNLNPAEVSNIKWISINELMVQLAQHPEDYTPWFKHILQKHSLFKELSLYPKRPK